jgi:cytochrome c peroxidase
VSLRGGVGGRGWLHQSATHQNALEFVDLVTRERLGGAGLAPEDATALARYLAWGIPRLQSPAVVEDRARRGQELFAARCAGCHRGPALTSGNPDPDDPYGGGAASGPALFDVGTAADDMKLILPRTFSQLLRQPARDLYAAVRGDRALGQDDMVQQVLQFRRRPERPRGMFRAPGLVNVWDNVLFFHDGRYTSLEQVLQHLDRHLALGLGRDERRDLIEYLKTL